MSTVFIVRSNPDGSTSQGIIIDSSQLGAYQSAGWYQPASPTATTVDRVMHQSQLGAAGGAAQLDSSAHVLRSELPAAVTVNVRDCGVYGDGYTDDTAAIEAAFGALTPGAELFFPAGDYLTSGLVFASASNFGIRAAKGANIWLAPSTAAAPAAGTRNVVTITDCTDFTVTGLTIDGRRDTIAPLLPLAANAASGQATVKLANGAAATLVVGQRINVLGGWTVSSGAQQNQADMELVIASITPGTSGAQDTVTFTANLANSYTSGSGTINDNYGPYAANGAYLTPWQTGETYSIGSRTLSEEDQQNGLHLINCKRFLVSGNTIRNVWESPIRCGTHNLTTAQNDGCSNGVIAHNILTHGYDQAVGLWCSHYITATSNIIDEGGWAGICMTGSDNCTITGNHVLNNAQLIPNGVPFGCGIGIEGGMGNIVADNQCAGSYGPGIYLTALGTLPFGSPAQVATSVASGSNAVALPAGTINVGSTTGFASSGSFQVLASGGPAIVYYTGVTGTSFTGCTGGGGLGTLYTGQKVVQYPLFINGGGSPVAAGVTTLTVSDGTKFQVGGIYSIIDNAKTERITVSGIASNIITLASATRYQHADKTQIGQAVPEANEIRGNEVSGSGDHGIRLAAAVRTQIQGNTVDRSGLNGIDLTLWSTAGLQAPYGSLIQGNTVTAPGTSGSLAYFLAIAATQVSDLQIVDNVCGGAPNLTGQGYFRVIGLIACSNVVLGRNTVMDANSVGIELDAMNEFVCSSVQVIQNTVSRCYGEGLKIVGGNALTVAKNLIRQCAANSNAGYGYGGGLSIRGVQNSLFELNQVIDCGHQGVGLDSATINSVTVATKGNKFIGNISLDDGANYDAWSGASTKQNTGFTELSAGQGPNDFLRNVTSGTNTGWNIISTGNTLSGNTGYNPVGKFSSQPGVPASGTAYTNTLNADATVYLTGGTVTAVSVGGQATGVTAGAFRVVAGQTITLTYSAAPTWVWFGD